MKKEQKSTACSLTAAHMISHARNGFFPARAFLSRVLKIYQTMKPYSQCCTILRRKISFAIHLGIAHQLVSLFLHRRDVGMK